ncbi:MAG: GNAT family N-acetyltransferase [Pseudomonadales bacterium]
MKAEFDWQPTLHGEQVIIRPIVASDWQGMFEAAADPQIWALHPVSDRYKAPVFRDFFDGAMESGSAFSIVDSRSGKIIGSSRYHGLAAALSEVEIGWTFLSRQYWGGQWNREMKELMLAHAFGYVESVIFLVGETNWRSQRAMEKIGGIRRKDLVQRVLNDRASAHIVYEITKGAFQQQSMA